ncbi:transposase [Massilia sp. TS11]|uniref:REP-associated tyrosine transposase n=1 Tax=Massilia sp. TS11 TaxID=2908003 RepID=UPI001EDB3AEE|nr:transposase [Massilia sp. TS11]MCG2585007.1 transposase [Massilia sp. TS11]
MTRPLRFEFPGAVYHLTARGNRQRPIFQDEIDRRFWLRILGEVCERRRFRIHAYCQMGNHYHLVLETPEPNLARGTHDLNGRYAQWFNARHRLVGHLFQGRYHAVLVQKERHLLELARYVVLNPVRAGLVAQAEDWPWSSHRAVLGLQDCPVWLDADATLSLFGDGGARLLGYQRFVGQPVSAHPLRTVQYQCVLGDAAFIAQHCRQVQPSSTHANRQQRQALTGPLSEIFQEASDRDTAIGVAYDSGAYSIAAIAAQAGVSTRTVGRVLAKLRRQS